MRQGQRKRALAGKRDVRTEAGQLVRVSGRVRAVSTERR
jgi:hypothetical protein